MESNIKKTEPRNPVAAMFPSPGPKYQLPSLIGGDKHDIRSKYTKAPSYSFGRRIEQSSHVYSPGPCYYPNPTVSKNGKEGSPKFSLYPRPKERYLCTNSGPSVYFPGMNKTLYHSDPSYSFGIKGRDVTTIRTPAANSYKLASVLGKCFQSNYKQAPCYSLSARNKFGGFYYDLQKTPGPGTYNVTENNIYMQKAPLYSMARRNLLQLDSKDNPSPAAYYPRKLNAIKNAAPEISFGIRHSPYIAPYLFLKTND